MVRLNGQTIILTLIILTCWKGLVAIWSSQLARFSSWLPWPTILFHFLLFSLLFIFIEFLFPCFYHSAHFLLENLLPTTAESFHRLPALLLTLAVLQNKVGFYDIARWESLKLCPVNPTTAESYSLCQQFSCLPWQTSNNRGNNILPSDYILLHTLRLFSAPNLNREIMKWRDTICFWQLKIYTHQLWGILCNACYERQLKCL